MPALATSSHVYWQLHNYTHLQSHHGYFSGVPDDFHHGVLHFSASDFTALMSVDYPSRCTTHALCLLKL